MFGLVGLVWQVWFGMFGLVGFVWFCIFCILCFFCIFCIVCVVSIVCTVCIACRVCTFSRANPSSSIMAVELEFSNKLRHHLILRHQLELCLVPRFQVVCEIIGTNIGGHSQSREHSGQSSDRCHPQPHGT